MLTLQIILFMVGIYIAVVWIVGTCVNYRHFGYYAKSYRILKNCRSIKMTDYSWEFDNIHVTMDDNIMSCNLVLEDKI